MEQYLKIGKLASPPVIGAGLGGLAGYIMEETVIDMIHKMRWVLPVICMFAGLGLGGFVSSKLL